MKRAVYCLLFFYCLSCQEKLSVTEEELYRPDIHFTPPKAWMNDPNGMVYYKGVYHLFYQHNPDSSVWGPMHWGHATSKNLIEWQHEPIALFPDSLGTIFSGSAVVDSNNTAGLQNPGRQRWSPFLHNMMQQARKKVVQIFKLKDLLIVWMMGKHGSSMIIIR